MACIVIVHGSCGNPNENWFPWIKNELENLNHRVCVPKSPTPENQKLNSWMNVFKKYEKNLDKNSILVGHSLGCAFIISVLENMETKIKASFFVAGFIGNMGNDYYDILTEFLQKEILIGKNKKRLQ